MRCTMYRTDAAYIASCEATIIDDSSTNARYLTCCKALDGSEGMTWAWDRCENLRLPFACIDA